MCVYIYIYIYIYITKSPDPGVTFFRLLGVKGFTVEFNKHYQLAQYVVFISCFLFWLARGGRSTG